MQWLHDMLASKKRIAVWQEKRRVAPLVAVLRGGREELKPLTESALAAIGPSAIPALLKASRKHGYGVLVEAGAAMGMMGTSALPQLIQAMEKESSRWVVKAIAIAMGEIGDPDAVPSLLAASSRVFEVDAIPEALGRIKDWRAADSLIEAYHATRSDSYRDFVKSALLKISKALPADRHEVRVRIDEILLVTKVAAPRRPRRTASSKNATWESVADSFTAEIGKIGAKGFRELQLELRGFPPAERHGAWARVAWACRQRNLEKIALQCFIQSVVADPDPQSASWLQIKLSTFLNGLPGFVERLAEMPRPRTLDDEDSVMLLAKDLEVHLGFPGS